MISISISGSLPRQVSKETVTKTVREVFKLVRPKASGNIGLRFVSEDEIQDLNRTYRHKNKPTDVLSFEISKELNVPIAKADIEFGDIVIAPAYAKREAARRKIDLAEEILRLVAHGTLHLLGFDHADEKSEARMFRLQEEAISKIV